jgi:uncharacterized protein (TIGR00288 family)
LEPDTPLAATPSRRIALLIDADNVSHAKIGAILAELSKYGTANIRRAYGNWAATTLKGWTGKLHDFAIRPIQQFSYSTGKNATDIALVIDAMELLYTQDLDAFAIASSDADFTPLIMQLKANGHEVYGFGERKTPTPFVNACTTFLFLDGLEDSAPPAEAEVEAPAAAQPKGAVAARRRLPLRRRLPPRLPLRQKRQRRPAPSRSRRTASSSPPCAARSRPPPATMAGRTWRRPAAR